MTDSGGDDAANGMSKTSSLHRTASEPAMKEKKPANCHPITRKAVSTEHTPLVLKKQEEVHPLPWFRSPEWSKRSPQASGHAHKKSHTSHHRRKRPHTNRYGKSHSWVSIFCCCGPSDDYDDMEAGVRSRMLARTATDDANAEAHGFRQCIQFLVGLIIIVAVTLIIMIIFRPFNLEQ